MVSSRELSRSNARPQPLPSLAIVQNSYLTCDLRSPTSACTISGRVYWDQVSLAGLGPVEVKLRAILHQTSNFDQFKRVDGVMGFTMGGEGNVFSRLVAGGACANVWAVCMKRGARSNGTLTIGGVDRRLSEGPVHYVPDVGENFRAVSVASLTLGAHSPVVVGQPAVLDTGTNVLLLPTHLMAQLQRQMCADSSLTGCSKLWANECIQLTQRQLASYPPLSLQLDGIQLRMMADDYLLLGSPVATAANQYCLGIRDGGTAGGNGFIIGDTTMRHYYLVFDLARNRIGWGNVSKSGCGSVEEGEVNSQWREPSF